MEKQDLLSLGGNAAVLQMLRKNGQNQPNPEVVYFSDVVTKINRKDREQKRVMLITDKAVYNLLPDSYSTCKRRIGLESIVGITASTVSEEFVLHVPDEYDYRFKSERKEKICDMIVGLHRSFAEKYNTVVPESSKIMKKIALVLSGEVCLKDVAVTKEAAKLQTREDRMRRKRELASQVHESDHEDQQEALDPSRQNQFTPLEDSGETGTISEKVRLEDFVLLKVLGRGSFGKVMQVMKKSDQKVYAMKILKKKAIIQRNQVEHTKAERKILQSLQHPFLMTLRYAFQSKEKLYFVLDYYPGGELFFHLKNVKRFSEDVARIYVAEIASALGHLHSLQVIYRDLKPENILLDENGHVCLTDFGLSKDIDPNNKAHTFCGTPEYLAPEVVAGVGHDKAVDWWSLGILLYELTVGLPPFYSQHVNEMYQKIQHGTLRFPPFLSDNCKSLIIALLNRDPKRRLGSENDFEDIKAHPFFAELDWTRLYNKDVEVPYKPRVKSEDDTANFDPTFTAEPVVDSVVAPSSLANSMSTSSDSFSGFTFAEKKTNFDF